MCRGLLCDSWVDFGHITYKSSNPCSIMIVAFHMLVSLEKYLLGFESFFCTHYVLSWNFLFLVCSLKVPQVLNVFSKMIPITSYFYPIALYKISSFHMYWQGKGGDDKQTHLPKRALFNTFVGWQCLALHKILWFIAWFDCLTLFLN
jgi:hypothetical protein